MHAGEEAGRGARVVAWTIAQWLAVVIFQAREDENVILQRAKRLEDFREIERTADCIRTPVAHVDAVRYVDESHAAGSHFLRRLRFGSQNRKHGLERR